MPAPLLKAGTVALRPLSARDATALGLEPAIAEALLQESSNGASLLWLIAPNPRQPGFGWIGLRGIEPLQRRASLDGFVLPAQRRQGHMREAASRVAAYAFDTLLLHRLGARLDPDNAAGIALLRGLSFSEEGRLRGYRIGADGQPRDVLLLSRLRGDSPPQEAP